MSSKMSNHKALKASPAQYKTVEVLAGLLDLLLGGVELASSEVETDGALTLLFEAEQGEVVQVEISRTGILKAAAAKTEPHGAMQICAADIQNVLEKVTRVYSKPRKIN